MQPQPNRYPPPSDQVNSNTLARMFSDVTNSYKFLFFMAILDNLERVNFANAPVPIEEVVLDMLTIAWYPHSYFKLSFGKQDLITTELDARGSDVLKENKVSPLDRTAIRQSLSRNAHTIGLTRYVPYRLIRPFFAHETRGLKDHHVNSRVAELAAEYFVSRKPPYKFNHELTSLIVHPEWLLYFQRNMVVLRGWVSWRWLEYMQKCNPNIPALATKLFPPLVRDSLNEQTKYWKTVAQHVDLKCIYSGERIVLNDLSLDHFVPWSFVAHDQLWNLIPTSRAVNSRKSDRLPAVKYLEKFADNQHTGILVAREVMPKWRQATACFYEALGLNNESELLNHEILRNRFGNTLVPLLQLAMVNGFEPEWQYDSAIATDD